MAASVCRHEQTNVKVNPRFRRQQDRLDPTIDAMSNPSRVFRRGGARLPTRGDPASGQPGHGRPIGRRLVEPMLLVVAPCRQPGRRRAGRPDVVVADGSVGAIAPLTLADRSIGNQSRPIPVIPPCERLLQIHMHTRCARCHDIDVVRRLQWLSGLY